MTITPAESSPQPVLTFGEAYASQALLWDGSYAYIVIKSGDQYSLVNLRNHSIGPYSSSYATISLNLRPVEYYLEVKS